MLEGKSFIGRSIGRAAGGALGIYLANGEMSALMPKWNENAAILHDPKSQLFRYLFLL